MSAFKALNIESDDESDIEIDDTKEIQIEEALKLYQNALKYDAEGPQSYGLAAEAYEQLFASEIFKYAESQTELQRVELYGLPETEDLWEDSYAGPAIVSGGLENGPSTLPQILHLSHKNYADFKLKALAAKFETVHVTLAQVLTDASAALDNFVQALDKDDTDLDLWRRTASVGEMLDSRRVARFCLESVMDEDDSGLNGVMSFPGLEEGFAAEQLKDLIAQLQDQLSVLQMPLSSSKRKIVSKMLKQRLHPYDDVLRQEKAMKGRGETSDRPPRPRNVTFKAPEIWADLGELLIAKQHTQISGLSISFDMSIVALKTTKAIDFSPPPPLTVTTVDSKVVRTNFPRTLSEQFPGLDNGFPTAQPQIAPAYPSMMMLSAGEDVAMTESPTEGPAVTLPSRKRSGDAAGLQDGMEEGRTKSRRTRARESTVDNADSRQAIIDANARWEYEQQLNEIQAADDWMFETVGNLFEKTGIIGFDTARNVRQEMSVSAESTPALDPPKAANDLKTARMDIQTFLDNFNDQQAQILLSGGEKLDRGQNGSLTGAGGSANSKSLSQAPPMPEDGLRELLVSVNDGWNLTYDVAWAFIEALLRPGKIVAEANTYTHFQWPKNLKTMVVRILVDFDAHIFQKAQGKLEDWKSHLDSDTRSQSYHGLAELAQSVFELHLDIYSLIKQPKSGVKHEIVMTQGDRLQRWSNLVREFMYCRSIALNFPGLGDALNLRFLWATTFQLNVSSDVSQNHVVECMNDLRATLVVTGEPVVTLQNNAIMPELSLAALDREISTITTRDFFFKVTNPDLRDPADIIESLEPLLEILDSNNQVVEGVSGTDIPLPLNVSPELVRFVQKSNMSVRFVLWQRLRDAYSGIDYKPMVTWCYLRMIRMVLDELKSTEVTGLAHVERQEITLESFRVLQYLVKKLFEITQSAKEALECVDEVRLKDAVNSFGEILQLVQVFNVAEDSLRVGLSQPPTLPNGYSVPAFKALTNLIHDMQVHIWTILYALLKDAISQNPDQYRTPLEDRFEFLRTVHRNLGLRGICGALNRSFVRMLKEEFFQMTQIEGCDSEQAQVLHDLYRLNCFLNPSYELMDHRCTIDAFLDRGAAMQAVDLLLAQASKLPIKELVKHSLRDTIDKVHGSLPKKRTTDAIMRNREVYRSFIRSPINPIDLYSCLKGEGNHLPITPVPKDDALLASKGWYFLMGHIALTRFRSQKRSGASPTEDVDIAIAFFMQDLEFTGENWETWFRLAQAYDTKIEEQVVWSAEKLNNHMSEIVTLQRHAIHCYTMATALAHRSADLAFETSEKMNELYYDFANRVYSSARGPFDMGVFDIDDGDNLKFLSVSTGVRKDKAFQPLRTYTAIKLANVLYKRALPGMSNNWMVHHMIGKCLFKMHKAADVVRRADHAPSASRVVEALVKALELLPDKDKKSDGKKEPVLEPHYKLVSVIHKLLTGTKTIDLQQAKDALNHSQYARKESLPESMDQWVPYILAVLRNLRAADKSNWYHRMIFRTARIVYENSGQSDDASLSEQNAGAVGAKHELTQQMFTKTMVLQVWRPESERQGRHFVYTAQYTRFFTRILEQLKDRSNLEQLARRVRRRPHDIFEHGAVWQDICTSYLRLLREYAALPEGLETSTFSNILHEEFTARKDFVENWMQAQDPGASTALDVLREVQELKKLNAGLTKPSAIDDLIGDSYAYLFNTIGRQLWEDERRVKQEDEARREAEAPLTVPSPARNPMMSLTHLMNLDGSSDAPPPQHTSLPPAPSVPQPAEQAPTRRKMGVGRREIRTCAEACFQKAKAQTSDAAKLTASARKVQVLIERERPLLSSDASVETSTPGSVHDSADDESELSELEEVDDDVEVDEPDAKPAPRPTFPKLATINGDGRGGDEGAVALQEEQAEEDVEMQDDVGEPIGKLTAEDGDGKE